MRVDSRMSGDLAPALDQAHRVEDRIEVHELEPRGLLPQFPHEPFLAGLLPVPGIGRARGGVGLLPIRRAGAACFAAERHVDDPAGQRLRGRGELRARQDALDAGQRRRLGARREDRPLGAFRVAIARGDVQRRRLRPAVDHQNGARDFDAGQVEELVALPELLVRRRFRRALHHDDPVADGLHHARPARRELVLLKRVGEQRRLREGGARRQDHEERENAFLLHRG